MEKKLPEGWINVVGVVLGFIAMIIGAAILIIIQILKLPEEISITLSEDPIPLEERIEHDLDVKFEEWEAEQKEEVEEDQVSYLIDVTEEDKALMARVVMSEVGSDRIDIDVKQAVAQTIVNRVRDGRWGTTVSEVVTYPYAYSTGNNGEPTEQCWQAVEAALIYEAFPLDMFYFREDHYHAFGQPYLKLGTTFFSTEKAAWD